LDFSLFFSLGFLWAAFFKKVARQRDFTISLQSAASSVPNQIPPEGTSLINSSTTQITRSTKNQSFE
jgi:hypothetical protein